MCVCVCVCVCVSLCVPMCVPLFNRYVMVTVLYRCIT